MDRQGAEDSPPLPSQHLSSAPLNVPPKRLSVDRTLNNRPQHFGDNEPDDRDNISDYGATTQPLADDELENHRYWYEAQQVETSLKICHVEKIWQNDKYVLRVL
ncbi:hypothetical protein ACJ73_09309 [Blastomyces percursus]|uniref:Uncharacterized protein n=1 Tax=Blastomyces percursus TaxID=1658174 RepID=A0A1J9P7V1_9EURO|nr:hypothetical protein ACJ73_09309 [Blastomyces percursus]